MDNQNNKNQGNKQNKVDEKKFMSQEIFCPMGAIPTSATYEILVSTLEKHLKELAENTLQGVHSASIYCNSTAPEARILAYVWLNPNSPEISTKGGNQQNSAIPMNLSFQSDNLKAFMKEYCREDRRKLISAEENRNYKGIEINFDKFMSEYFDVDGSIYSQIFGGAPVRSKLQISKKFTRKGEPRLVSIEVVKTKASKSTGKLTPKRNMKH